MNGKKISTGKELDKVYTVENHLLFKIVQEHVLEGVEG